MFILSPYVHGHEMDVHYTSNFRHPLVANVWMSTGCPILELVHTKRDGRQAMSDIHIEIFSKRRLQKQRSHWILLIARRPSRPVWNSP